MFWYYFVYVRYYFCCFGGFLFYFSAYRDLLNRDHPPDTDPSIVKKYAMNLLLLALIFGKKYVLRESVCRYVLNVRIIKLSVRSIPQQPHIWKIVQIWPYCEFYKMIYERMFK